MGSRFRGSKKGWAVREPLLRGGMGRLTLGQAQGYRGEG